MTRLPPGLQRAALAIVLRGLTVAVACMSGAGGGVPRAPPMSPATSDGPVAHGTAPSYFVNFAEAGLPKGTSSSSPRSPAGTCSSGERIQRPASASS